MCGQEHRPEWSHWPPQRSSCAAGLLAVLPPTCSTLGLVVPLTLMFITRLVGRLVDQSVWSEGLSASQSVYHNFIKDREVPCSCGRTKTLPAEYHDGPTDTDKSDNRVSCLTKWDGSVCVVCDSTFKGNSNKIYTIIYLIQLGYF